MYHYLKGQLDQIQPTYLVIEAAGVGYQIWAANPFHWQDQLNQEVKVFVELVVREDDQKLYGFKDEQEKQLFLQLNKVSGIGPKSAMSILALDDQSGLIQAIDSADAKYLMKFPGVGKKTAQQMILDLQGKLDLATIGQKTATTQLENSLIDEIEQALVGLGYSRREIDRVLPQIEKAEPKTSQAGLSMAFKLLIK